MSAEFRVLEEKGLFFIQEKVYREYDSISRFTRWLFRMPMNEFTWMVICNKAYFHLEDALIKANDLRMDREAPRQEPKYHYLNELQDGYIDPHFIDKFKPTINELSEAVRNELDKLKQ